MQKKTIPLLVDLWLHLSPKRHLQFKFLLVLMVLSSFAEVLSIGAVLPFLGVLLSPERIFATAAFRPVINIFDISEAGQLILPVTIIFCIMALMAGSIRLLLLWVTTRLSFAVGADLSGNIYLRTLYQPYIVQCMRNSSEVVNGIASKVSDVVLNVIIPSLSLISSAIVSTAIFAALMLINPMVAIGVLGSFGVAYFLIMRVTRKRLLTNSEVIARESSLIIKMLQEGLGGIRDVLIDGTQEVLYKTFRECDSELRRAQGNSIFLAGGPRYLVESIGMILIALLSYFLAQGSNGLVGVIPVLGALALGAQRVLPALQQSYNSWASINSRRASLTDVINLLDQPMQKFIPSNISEKLSFKNEIHLNGVNFSYGSSQSLILRDINLKIKKGSRLGIVGTTGSGKTTLADIIMGLLEPSEGSLEIDGVIITPNNSNLWRAMVAHVPQSIFLSDATIEENIAFGVPKELIDRSIVRGASIQAQIFEDIEALPEKFSTKVGERGVKLSGGQRQRIGIARALYKKAEVIIFDEATSALDGGTEEEVMRAIDKLGPELTLVMIAHRTTTLSSCTEIIEVNNGNIKN